MIANLVGCPNEKEEVSLSGQVEGTYIYIGASYSGILNSLYVMRGSPVKSGQPLFTLSLQPEQDQFKVTEQRVEEAKAQQEKSDAEYKLRKKLLDRKRGLSRKSDSSKDEFDTAEANSEEAYATLKAAKANVAALEAELAKAKWTTQQKVVNATSSGVVFDIYYHRGELVPNGHPVISILDPSTLKIVFYCPEPLLSKIKLNQIIQASCDNCRSFSDAKITFISPQAEYTPPVIYSNEERQKFVYRVEAQPLKNVQLHAGQLVTVRIS